MSVGRLHVVLETALGKAGLGAALGPGLAAWSHWIITVTRQVLQAGRGWNSMVGTVVMGYVLGVVVEKVGC